MKLRKLEDAWTSGEVFLMIHSGNFTRTLYVERAYLNIHSGVILLLQSLKHNFGGKKLMSACQIKIGKGINRPIIYNIKSTISGINHIGNISNTD